MLGNINDIVLRLKEETNNIKDIIYRKKKVCGRDLYIIYNEPITSSDMISDFIIRSLTRISYKKSKDIVSLIDY